MLNKHAYLLPDKLSNNFIYQYTIVIQLNCCKKPEWEKKYFAQALKSVVLKGKEIVYKKKTIKTQNTQKKPQTSKKTKLEKKP